MIKKIQLLSLWMLLGNISLIAQNCNQNIFLNTQAEIDAFSVTYPGCTQFMGSISIVGATPTEITDLSGLNQLTSIQGNLSISDNVSLSSLNGLHNITSIGGDLYLQELAGLSNLNGLNSVTSVGGIMRIRNNPDLLNLLGLENLATVGSIFSIQDNDSLKDINDLSSLTFIGNSFVIFDCPSIVSFSGVNNLVDVGNNFEIGGGMDALASISGFQSLQIIEGDLRIGGIVLQSITGMNSLSSADYFYLENNPILTDISGFSGLASVFGTLTIRNNTVLNDLTPLSNLTSVGIQVIINNNDSLQSLDGLDNIELQSNNSNFIGIYNNPMLSICNQAFFCSHLASGVSRNIFNNASGCNSDSEIIALCDPSLFACHGVDLMINNIFNPIYRAFNSITSGGEVYGNRTFTAGNIISLDNHFTVHPGAEFEAIIQTCDNN